MKILITGPRGFVGKRLMQQYPNAVGAPSLQNLGQTEICRLLEETSADVILHTAAISDIGQCAADPEGSYRANVLLPEWLAKHSGGAKLVFFSSDQVYSGCREPGPYPEEITCPGNLYAQHKLEMERRVLEIDPDAVLLRAEWMYDWIAPKGNYFRNVVLAENAVGVSFRQYRGVTYLREVAEVMDRVIRLPGGAYNFGSETDKTMEEITREFLSLLGKKLPMENTGNHHNLWMDCTKAKRLGVNFSDVSQGLRRCARDYGFLG